MKKIFIILGALAIAGLLAYATIISKINSLNRVGTRGTSETTASAYSASVGFNVASTTVCSIYNGSTRDRIISRDYFYVQKHNDATTTGAGGAWSISMATSSSQYATTTGANHFLTDYIIGTSTPQFLHASTTPINGVAGSSVNNIWKASSYLLWKTNKLGTTTATGFCGVDYWPN